jgi:hypothetical protein
MRLTHSPIRRRPDRRSSDRRSRRGPCCTSRSIADQPTTPPMSSAPEGRRATVQRRLVVITEVAALALLLSASAAHAETAQVLALAGSIDQVLTNIRNWVMGILAGLATVFLSIGGVRRVMGGGDPGEQEKAKECFKAAAIGYGLAALAPLVVTVLQGIVGA